MNRTLSGVLLVGLAVLVLYLWASGRLNGLSNFVSAQAQGQRTKPYVLGGSKPAGGGGGGEAQISA